MNYISKIIFATISFLVVAFGQPVWSSWTGMIASALGYSLFWHALLTIPKRSTRFWIAFAWFTCIQLIQLSWFISHPYWYIYLVYFALSAGIGVQFGLLSLCISFSTLNRIRIMRIAAIAALWTLMEWSRLLVLSGLSWNPAGLALTGNIYSLQMASLCGVLGLSFWVVFTNLLALRAWAGKTFIYGLPWMIAAALPYAYGAIQLTIHSNSLNKTLNNPESYLQVALVQTAFPIEEAISFKTQNDKMSFILNEWKKILNLTKKIEGKNTELIVLPEFVVPYGTYAFVYPLEKVLQAFITILGPESIKALPPIQLPFALFQKSETGLQPLVNNAYWAQGLANYFQSPLLLGLEDAEDTPVQREYYSAALYFKPIVFEDDNRDTKELPSPDRYAKRVLVPMGEYIPFSFCQKLAAEYGIFGSFTHGTEAVIMSCGKWKLSPSICYEETFGDIIRESKQKGAQVLVNLTSDVWYPNSKLPAQHLYHAIPRTVENGLPLIRACNTGVTAVIDSFGREIAVLGGAHPEKVEWTPDVLMASVPIYEYQTLYSIWGDTLIVAFCLLMLLGFISTKKSSSHKI